MAWGVLTVHVNKIERIGRNGSLVPSVKLSDELPEAPRGIEQLKVKGEISLAGMAIELSNMTVIHGATDRLIGVKVNGIWPALVMAPATRYEAPGGTTLVTVSGARAIGPTPQVG